MDNEPNMLTQLNGPQLEWASIADTKDQSQTEFLDCMCDSEAHVLRFKLDTHDPDDVELYTSVFLNQYRGFFHRLWIAVKYLFGYKCRHGHWDCTVLKVEDANRLISLLHKYKALSSFDDLKRKRRQPQPEVLDAKPDRVTRGGDDFLDNPR